MMLALALLIWVCLGIKKKKKTSIVDKDCVLQKEKINLLMSNNHMAI